jgi:hypothetical protein
MHTPSVCLTSCCCIGHPSASGGSERKGEIILAAAVVSKHPLSSPLSPVPVYCLLSCQPPRRNSPTIIATTTHTGFFTSSPTYPQLWAHTVLLLAAKKPTPSRAILWYWSQRCRSTRHARQTRPAVRNYPANQGGEEEVSRHETNAVPHPSQLKQRACEMHRTNCQHTQRNKSP